MYILYNKEFNLYPLQLSSFFAPKVPLNVALSVKIVGIALAALGSLIYILSVAVNLQGGLSNKKAQPLKQPLLSSLSQEVLKPIPENAYQLKECSLKAIRSFLAENPQVKEVYVKSVPVSTALLNQLLQKEIPLKEQDLTSCYTLEDAKGTKHQLTGFEKALLMQYSDLFHDFWRGKNQQKITLIEDIQDFESLRILLKSLYDPKILEEKEWETCSLAAASFKFHLNREEMDKRLEKFLVASFEQKDQHNIETLLKFFKLYQKPLTLPIQQAIQKWLNRSIGTSSFLTHIHLLKHYSPDSLNFSLTCISDQELAYVCGLSLSTLILSRCKTITDQGLKHLKNLKQLQNLNLKDCKNLTDQGLKHLKNLKQLQSLNLGWYTHITDQGFECLKGLTQLLKLNLNCSEITDQGLEHLKNLTKLKELNLKNCEQITSQGLKHLKDLLQLEKLDLGTCTSITDQGLEYLKGCTQLKKLDLGWCDQITDQGLAYLKNFTQLQVLNLRTCFRITNQGLEYLKNFTQLKVLNLNWCENLTDQGLEHLKDLIWLKKLDLGWCDQITDQGLKYLKNFTQLQRLNLNSCNQITDQGLAYLDQLPQLKSLILRNCSQVSSKIIVSLKSKGIVVDYI